jgi:hypothetical protein
MIAELTSHLRTNGAAYLALFLALGSSAVAATSLEDRSVKSRHIATDAVRSRHIRHGAVERGDLASDAVGTGQVEDNALKGRDIDETTLQDVSRPGHAHPRTRSVSLPLSTFTDCDSDAGGFLDYSNASDRAPDFVRNSVVDGSGAAIQFDDTLGSEDQAFDICAQLAVPEDWQSGGEVQIRASAGRFPTPPDELIRCRFAPNGQGGVNVGRVVVGGTGSHSVTCSPEVPPFSRDGSLVLDLAIEASSAMNDPIRVYAVDFVYAAAG